MFMMNVIAATSLAAGQIPVGGDPDRAQDIITGSDVDSIRNIASAYGKVYQSEDKSGDPKLVGRMNGARYIVYFYGCKRHTDCDSIQFYYGLSSNKDYTQTVDDWNRTMRFATASIDEDGDPVLTMDVTLVGGLTRANMTDWFDLFDLQMGDFRGRLLD